MNHREDLKQQSNICDGCANISGTDPDNCVFCLSFLESFATDQQLQPVALGGGNGLDIQSKQEFISSSGLICESCQKPEGSNSQCQICAFFKESAETARNGDKNPDVPLSIKFQEGVGPRQEDLCALTPDEVQKSVDLFRCVFWSKVLPLIPVESRVLDSHVGLWRGCEWSSGNCWFVVLLQMFQTGSWHTSINVSNPLGNALWILVHELRTRGFVPRQRLQAFRRLMAENIGQNEKGTLFENGQMDPFEALKMLEDAGAFKYYFSLSSNYFIQGINATPVIDLGRSPSSSTNLTERTNALGIDIQFDQNSNFSFLPAVVVRVSQSEQKSGSIVDFPNYAKFDICQLAFQIMSVLLFIKGHYLTVFIRLMYDPKTDTIYTTYWVSDSKSDDPDCGHHVPSIVKIDQEHFERLWWNHAVSITCVRIPDVVQIDGNPYERIGAYLKPLIPVRESLPQCNEDQYMIFGPNREILIKECTRFQQDFQRQSQAPCASGPLVPPPPPPAPSASGQWVPPPPPQAPCSSGQWVPPPLPQAPCSSGQWVPPPLPQAPCSSGQWVPPPPPQAPSAQSARAIQSQQPHSVNITMADVKHNMDSSMMRRWSVSFCHPTKGQITLSGGYSESTKQSNVINYTFDSDNSEPKRLFKYELNGQCKKFIEELNRKLNA